MPCYSGFTTSLDNRSTVREHSEIDRYLRVWFECKDLEKKIKDINNFIANAFSYFKCHLEWKEGLLHDCLSNYQDDTIENYQKIKRSLKKSLDKRTQFLCAFLYLQGGINSKEVKNKEGNSFYGEILILYRWWEKHKLYDEKFGSEK